MAIDPRLAEVDLGKDTRHAQRIPQMRQQERVSKPAQLPFRRAIFCQVSYGAAVTGAPASTAGVKSLE
jgi:hypothetical protein